MVTASLSYNKNVNHGLKLYTFGVQMKLYACVGKVYMSRW